MTISIGGKCQAAPTGRCQYAWDCRFCSKWLKCYKRKMPGAGQGYATNNKCFTCMHCKAGKRWSDGFVCDLQAKNKTACAGTQTADKFCEQTKLSLPHYNTCLKISKERL